MRLPLALFVAALALPVTAHAGKAFDTGSISGTQLVEHLGHADWRFRHDACEELAERKMVQAKAEIRARATEDSNERVRRECFAALRLLAPDEVVELSRAMVVGGGGEGMRRTALEVLEEHGGDESAAAVAQVLVEDKEAGMRRRAAVVLKKRGWWTGARAELERAALEDPDEDVREAVRDLIVGTGDVSLRPILHRVALEDPDPRTRLEVIERMEKNPLPEDKAVLIQALDDPYPHSARHAARALVRLGDRGAAPVLRDKAMGATDRKVAEEFNEAATKLED